METVLGLIVGIGLSAACGFRVFVPMLGMSIAALSGHVTLAPGFEWIGSWPAILAFSTATVLEICAYYIPWFDHLMDTIMTPAAIVAGTILTASMIGEMSPFLRWSLALIAGGGVSAIIQGGTVVIRAISTGTTGGLANFIVSTLEAIGAFFATLLALLVPVLCAIGVVVLLYFMIRKLARSQRLRKLFA